MENNWIYLLKMRQFEKKFVQNLKMILNGRLSEQQLKTKIITKEDHSTCVPLFNFSKCLF